MKPEKEDHFYRRYKQRMHKNLQIKTGLICCILIVLRGYHSFAQEDKPVTHRYYNNFEDSIMNKEWMNENTITFNGHDSIMNHFSRTDLAHHYSSGIEIDIPQDLNGKNIRITIDGRILNTSATADNQAVISLSKGDSVIFWTGQHVPDPPGKINEWNKFTVTTLIPGNISRNSRVKIFLWNADGKSQTDIDDLDIYFTIVKFPSFLPE